MHIFICIVINIQHCQERENEKGESEDGVKTTSKTKSAGAKENKKMVHGGSQHKQRDRTSEVCKLCSRVTVTITIFTRTAAGEESTCGDSFH